MTHWIYLDGWAWACVLCNRRKWARDPALWLASMVRDGERHGRPVKVGGSDSEDVVCTRILAGWRHDVVELIGQLRRAVDSFDAWWPEDVTEVPWVTDVEMVG